MGVFRAISEMDKNQVFAVLKEVTAHRELDEDPKEFEEKYGEEVA